MRQAARDEPVGDPQLHDAEVAEQQPVGGSPRGEGQGDFQAAVALIAIRLIVLSFELAGDLLTTGAGLIAAGLLILAVAYGALRIAQRYAPAPAEARP